MTATVVSIQGEQGLADVERRWAALGAVDKYAAAVEGTGTDVCRQRNRHRYAPLPDRAPFDGYSPSGYLVRETEPCLDCGLAYQIQRYEPYETKQGRRTVVRFRPAYNTTEYLTGPDGETYLLPRGQGYVRPRDYRDSVVTRAVNADPESQALAGAALKQRKEVLARRADHNPTTEEPTA